MKKIISILLSVIMMASLLIIPNSEQFYAAPSISINTSATSVNIGDTVSVTVSIPEGYAATLDIKFSNDIFKYLEASTSEVGTKNESNGYLTVGLSSILNLKSVTFKFQAISSGDAVFKAHRLYSADENLEEEVWMDDVEVKVTVANQAIPDITKSDDNSLASMKLSAGTLSPAFKYNVTNYTATVDYNVSSVVVSVKTSHEKATIESVTGNGKVSLNVGENIIAITVKAENGEKATYKIVVTRKAQESGGQNTEDTSTETETDTEETIEGMDSGLSWNGSSLIFTEEIPTEVIPADFSKETMMFQNVEIPCLNSNKSNMTVLYLKTSDGKGALYVYDRDEQNIYPFIKLTSNDRYVIVLWPDELSAPEGYEMFSLSIEGKGIVTACRPVITESGDDVEDSQIMEFSLLYCMNNEGNFGWYQYDSVEKTFQRYTASVSVEGPFHTDTEGEIGEFEDVDDMDNRELKAQLKEEQNKNLKMICIFVFVLAVLLVVIFNLILTRQRNDEDTDDELEDTLTDDEGDETKEYKKSTEVESQEKKLSDIDSGKNQEIKKEINNEKNVNDEFIEDSEEINDTTIENISAKLMEEASKDVETEEDDDFEFIDL